MRHARWILLALLTASGLTVTAQKPGGDLGAIVLLAATDGHTADAKLQSALLDADPRTRGISARVIAAGAHLELRGSVIGALLREKDPDAGAELVRTALHLSGGQDLAAIEPHARRLGTRAMAAQVEWLARARPAEFLAALPALADQPGMKSLAVLVSVAVAQHPAKAGELFDAWLRVAPEHGWRELLDSEYAGRPDVSGASALLVRALGSSRPAIRDETVWFLVRALRDKQQIPAAVLDAALDAVPQESSGWEQFGRELIARQHRKARTPDRTSLLTSAANRRGIDVLDGLPDLYPDERKAVLRLVRDRRLPLLVYREPNRSASRTIDLPSGAVAATLQHAGCKARPGAGIASIGYWPDGRPRQITLERGDLDPSCMRALDALSRISIAEFDYAAVHGPQLIVVPLHPAFRQCDSQRPNREHSTEVRDSREVTSPKLLREIKPDYTRAAMDARIEGIMTLSARLSEQGCVEYSTVTRSVPGLDGQGLLAVTQWTFEPAHLEGERIPVHVSIELTFKLK